MTDVPRITENSEIETKVVVTKLKVSWGKTNLAEAGQCTMTKTFKTSVIQIWKITTI